MNTIEILDLVLPDLVIQAGVRGRNIRRNVRTQVINGTESVNVQWDYTRREFELGYIPMRVEAWQELEALSEVTDAGARGFLMFDPKDRTVAATQGRLLSYNDGVAVGAMGSGYGEPVLYLFKRYASLGGVYFRDRPLSRPLAPVVLRNGTPVAVGVAPGNIAVAGGRVTFVADAQQTVSAITPGANTVLTFADGAGMFAAVAVGQRLFITGVAGSAAAALNGVSHLITAKGDGPPYTLTLATPTTGLTGTGGTAFKYPQSTDALTWSGEFYTPVHFANDVLDWDLMKPGPDVEDRIVAGPSVLLSEVLELP